MPIQHWRKDLNATAVGLFSTPNTIIASGNPPLNLNRSRFFHLYFYDQKKQVASCDRN